MPFQTGPRLRAFLDEPLPLVVGTSLPPSGAHMLPTWYEFRDDLFWVNSLFWPGRGPTALWLQNLKRNPNATLLLRDPKSSFRWVRIEAHLLDTVDGATDHLARLSQRYAGEPKPDPGVDPQTIRFTPVHISGGSDSGAEWDSRS